MLVAELDMVAEAILGGDQYVNALSIGAPPFGITESDNTLLPSVKIHVGQSKEGDWTSISAWVLFLEIKESAVASIVAKRTEICSNKGAADIGAFEIRRRSFADLSLHASQPSRQLIICLISNRSNVNDAEQGNAIEDSLIVIVPVTDPGCDAAGTEHSSASMSPTL
jgi:hypothetical protein